MVAVACQPFRNQRLLLPSISCSWVRPFPEGMPPRPSPRARTRQSTCRFAERLASKHRRQHHKPYLYPANAGDTSRLYEALLQSDNVLLRGVSCYLKSHLLWRTERITSVSLSEEMAFNLYIALEAGLSVLRRRLSEQEQRRVSFDDVFRFVANTFSYGEGLAEYWRDCHDDRNALLHPDSIFGAYVMHPMVADDIYELLDPMQSLYRYLLLGELRPAFVR